MQFYSSRMRRLAASVGVSSALLFSAVSPALAVTTINLNVATGGDLTVGGNTILGDAAADTVTVNGTVAGTTRHVDLGVIGDANGNELLILDTVASAVNELTLANAATGNNPTLTMSGGDSAVSLSINSKGTNSSVIFGTTNANADRIQILPQSATANDPFNGTITSADLTAARTWTFPDATLTVAGTNFAQTWSATQTFNGGISTATFTVNPATKDPIIIAPLTGSTGDFSGTITSADLTAARTWTFPDASGTVTLLGNASTGSGSVVLATSPTLVTPVLGVATATTINKVAFTAPASGSTL
ncbi:hypothetical protein HY633_00370, partial [Candidatus Uhrbacteria bacterium]|nr:hypothetical protein [Candidatus Uhrbacteria bacterium]